MIICFGTIQFEFWERFRPILNLVKVVEPVAHGTVSMLQLQPAAVLLLPNAVDSIYFLSASINFAVAICCCCVSQLCVIVALMNCLLI